MNMVSIKTNIISWCEQDNIPAKVQDVKPDDSVLQWSITIDKIAVYNQKRFPDRVYLQNDINFSPEQREMMSKWDNVKRTNFVASLSKNAIEFDYQNEFLLDGNNIKGIRIHKFLVGDFTKSDFVQLLVRVQNILGYTFNLLNLTMGTEMNLHQQQTQAGSENPLST
jgi:hypothetical protein